MSEIYLSKINQAIFSLLNADWGLRADKGLGAMIFDALGFERDGKIIPNSGKRIRPTLACLTCGAFGGDIDRVLPAAAALELLHNFTLIHDDIEDCSDLRHGRPTVWKRCGQALAINGGDYLIGLCFRSVHAAARAENLPVFIDLFDEMYKKVTFGQHLDMSFENRLDLTTDDYLGMISGKTVALLRGAMQLGAAAAGADAVSIQRIRDAGKKAGIAFQLQDDYLGIWGETDRFGKSVSTDITGKKTTFPIIFALGKSAEFSDFWQAYDGSEEKVGEIRDRLEALGAREATRTRVREESGAARAILAELFGADGSAAGIDADRAALIELIEFLMTRDR